MKKLTFGLLVLTLSLCEMPSAHAVRLVSLINVGSGHIVDKIMPLRPRVSGNENYHERLAECRLEIEQVQNELDRQREVYRQAIEREYDLRREEEECWDQVEELGIYVEECIASGENTTSYEDEYSGSTESGDPASDAMSMLSENNWYGFMDYLVNGTCEEPRNGRMCARCLEECHADLRYRQQNLEKIKESNLDVKRTFERRIRNCEMAVELLEVMSDLFCNSDPEDDSDENSHDPVDGTMTVDTPSAPCGLVHCS